MSESPSGIPRAEPHPAPRRSAARYNRLHENDRDGFDPLPYIVTTLLFFACVGVYVRAYSKPVDDSSEVFRALGYNGISDFCDREYELVMENVRKNIIKKRIDLARVETDIFLRLPENPKSLDAHLLNATRNFLDYEIAIEKLRYVSFSGEQNAAAKCAIAIMFGRRT